MRSGSLTALFVLALAIPSALAQVPTIESAFGFRMGTEGRLASWAAIERYFEAVAAASDRVDLVTAGKTTDGRRLLVAIVSAPENLQRLTAIQSVNRRLADPRTSSLEDARTLVAGQPVIVAVGCSIHSTEIGGTQAASEILHQLATAGDARTLGWLREVVVLLIPSLNPDGHALTVEWHDRQLGTPFEQAPMPWLYHKYAGHDINRDAFMLNLAESRSLARFFYREWHPQVFLTLHQMGGGGPRLSLPPMHDPVPPNVDPLVWRAQGVLGNAMAMELEREGRTGVITNALYDYYWPGYEDSAPLGHNTVCLLAEAASARGSQAANVARGDLKGNPRGLPSYAPQVNFPNPWRGGRWTLADIVDYFTVAVRGLLDGASRHRSTLLENFHLMGRRAIERGEAGEPFAFLITTDQHDAVATAKLTSLLVENGVELRRAEEPFRAGGEAYPEGTLLVLMAQPFRAFAKTLLERQAYPLRRTPSGAIESPYDLAGWTLPLQMGVRVVEAIHSFELPLLSGVQTTGITPGKLWGERRPAAYVIDGRGLAGARVVGQLLDAQLSPRWTRAPIDVEGYRYAAGSILINATPEARRGVDGALALGLRASGIKGKPPADAIVLDAVRTGLYKPWTASIDEGWTRWALEEYKVPFVTVVDEELRRGDLRARFDVLILPSETPDRLRSGQRAGTVPPEYAGGIGDQGLESIRAFVYAGGTLVALDRSSGLAIDLFGLPVKNAVAGLTSEQFLCPGSLLKLSVDPTNPLAFGLSPDAAALFVNGPAFEIGTPASGGSVTLRSVARYADTDILLSGLLIGPERIAGRSALVEATFGAGRVILFGFRPQHRAQTLGTLRFLFNAILSAQTSRRPAGGKE